jgi:hypothetical protein
VSATSSSGQVGAHDRDEGLWYAVSADASALHRMSDHSRKHSVAASGGVPGAHEPVLAGAAEVAVLVAGFLVVILLCQQCFFSV